MEKWLKISLLLCIFGFLKEFRPSEPYVTLYLLSPWKGFTEDQVNQEIYPVWVYSSLGLLVVVFLVTDILRYKSVIVVEGISAVVTWTLITWTQGLPLMKVAEVFYGLFTASEVAYFTYTYAKVDKKLYQKITSYARAAFLAGQALSSILAQIVIGLGLLNFQYLNYITVASVSLATMSSLVLPSVEHSTYFHQGNGEEGITSLKSQSIRVKLHKACTLLWEHLIHAYSNCYVLKWSLWWAVSTCGYYQIIMYIQLLWETIESTQDGNLYNGAVIATYTLLGACTTFACGWLRLNWESIGEVAIGVVSGIQGAMLILSAKTTQIWTAYICYVVFGIAYNITITIANSEVAKHIHEDSYALVFGINTWFALLLESLLTLVVVSESGLALKTRDQFVFYGYYFVVFAVVFLIVAVISLVKSQVNKSLSNN